MAQYYLARTWWLPQALHSLQKILLPGSFPGPLSSNGEDHVGLTVEGTKASAESSGSLRHPNSAQDTERAVDQTSKSKSHSKTKDKDGPKSTSSRVERTRPENSSAQSAGKASKRNSASQSHKHSKARKARTQHSDSEAHSHNHRPRRKRKETFHSEKPRPGSDSPKSTDSVSGSSGSVDMFL